MGDSLGLGHTAEQAAQVRVDDQQLLIDYLTATLTAFLEYSQTLTEADLDEVIDEDWTPPVTTEGSAMAESNENIQKVRDIIKGTRIAMLTHVDEDGRLVSKPMATQDVDFDGTVRFIAERASGQGTAIQKNPNVNVAYAGSGAWVSLSGSARIVNDTDKLRELWSSFTDSWLEGGPENPNNVLIEIDADTAEYWDSPGSSKVTQVANLIKAKVTGNTVEGENEVVDL